MALAKSKEHPKWDGPEVHDALPERFRRHGRFGTEVRKGAEGKRLKRRKAFSCGPIHRKHRHPHLGNMISWSDACFISMARTLQLP